MAAVMATSIDEDARGQSQGRREEQDRPADLSENLGLHGVSPDESKGKPSIGPFARG
jgi:hypothetical protein